MREMSGPCIESTIEVDRRKRLKRAASTAAASALGSWAVFAHAEQNQSADISESEKTVQKNFFRGLSAFPLTPADEAGRVDAANYSSILERLANAKVDSITVLGSTGTYTFLNRTERRRAVETAVKTVGGRIPVMAGIGSLRTNDVLDLARDAQAVGASGLLLAPVSYFPLRKKYFNISWLFPKSPICRFASTTTQARRISNLVIPWWRGLPRFRISLR